MNIWLPNISLSAIRMVSLFESPVFGSPLWNENMCFLHCFTLFLDPNLLKNTEKLDFHKPLECPTPKSWSKFTINNTLQKRQQKTVHSPHLNHLPQTSSHTSSTTIIVFSANFLEMYLQVLVLPVFIVSYGIAKCIAQINTLYNNACTCMPSPVEIHNNYYSSQLIFKQFKFTI